MAAQRPIYDDGEPQSAKIYNRDGTSRDLIPAGTSSDDLERVAYSNECLARLYQRRLGADAAEPRAAGTGGAATGDAGGGRR